jgi:hypothetical protein
VGAQLPSFPLAGCCGNRRATQNLRPIATRREGLGLNRGCTAAWSRKIRLLRPQVASLRATGGGASHHLGTSNWHFERRASKKSLHTQLVLREIKRGEELLTFSKKKKSTHTTCFACDISEMKRGEEYVLTIFVFFKKNGFNGIYTHRFFCVRYQRNAARMRRASYCFKRKRLHKSKGKLRPQTDSDRKVRP